MAVKLNYQDWKSCVNCIEERFFRCREMSAENEVLACSFV